MDYTYELVGSFSWRVIVGKSFWTRKQSDLYGCNQLDKHSFSSCERTGKRFV